jgi:hypothetical protein
VLAALGGEQGASACLSATPTGVFGLEFGCVTLINDEAVVVVQLFTRGNIAQGFDKDTPTYFIGLTIGVTRVINPLRRVALVQAVNDAGFVNMEIKGMVGVRWIVGMAGLGFLPCDDFPAVLDNGFAFSEILDGKDTSTMDPGTPRLNTALAR